MLIYCDISERSSALCTWWQGCWLSAPAQQCAPGEGKSSGWDFSPSEHRDESVLPTGCRSSCSTPSCCSNACSLGTQCSSSLESPVLCF